MRGIGGVSAVAKIGSPELRASAHNPVPVKLRARLLWARTKVFAQTTRGRITIVALVFACTFTFDYNLAQRHGFFDLNVYHGAINYWVHGGGSLYDFLSPQTTYGFTYPPFAALVMLPMALISFNPTIWLSCIACIAATVLLVHILVDPLARRQGWVRWYAVLLVTAVAVAFEPLRETFLFGQVNIYLVLLVALDLLVLLPRGSRFTGVGIGLATAIKLTPAVFLVYLVVTRRWKAAIVGSITATVATVAAAAIAPSASRVFWTDALWNTDRIGSVAFISNQSLNGAIARLNPGDPSKAAWIASALVVTAIWLFRVRRAVAAGDEATGFALTGVLGCLISPITWVHHLVWVGPAVLLLLDHALSAPTRRRRNWLLVFLICSYVLLCSRLVWSFSDDFSSPITWPIASAYVWMSVILLCFMPIKEPTREIPQAPLVDSDETAGTLDVEAVPQLRELDREFAGLLDDERAPASVRPESVSFVKGDPARVAREHP
jgi:alpha-1,2-mannosyltransferase